MKRARAAARRSITCCPPAARNWRAGCWSRPRRAKAGALLVKLRAEAAIGPLGLDQRWSARSPSTAQRWSCTAIEQRDFSAPDLSVPQRLQHAVLRSGILGEQVWLQWAHEVLPLLRRAAPQEGGAA